MIINGLTSWVELQAACLSSQYQNIFNVVVFLLQISSVSSLFLRLINSETLKSKVRIYTFKKRRRYRLFTKVGENVFFSQAFYIAVQIHHLNYVAQARTWLSTAYDGCMKHSESIY